MELLDGTIIEKNKDGEYPALKELNKDYGACQRCPLNVLCAGDEYKCLSFNMFRGFECTTEDILKFVKEN